jgi:hypothetical protein
VEEVNAELDTPELETINELEVGIIGKLDSPGPGTFSL